MHVVGLPLPYEIFEKIMDVRPQVQRWLLNAALALNTFLGGCVFGSTLVGLGVVTSMLSYCSRVGKGNWRSTWVGLSAGLAIYYWERKKISLNFGWRNIQFSSKCIRFREIFEVMEDLEIVYTWSFLALQSDRQT